MIEYRLNTVQEAKDVASEYLKNISIEGTIKFGLPEIDDRYHVWRVPLKDNHNKIGEIVIDAKTGRIDDNRTTTQEMLHKRLQKPHSETQQANTKQSMHISDMNNTVACGDSEELLAQTQSESVDLVFTSPPYFNARPEYTDYADYNEYLNKMERIFAQAHRVLNEGRFFVINVSPILLRRASRNESSRRLAVPFDFHQLLINTDF